MNNEGELIEKISNLSARLDLLEKETDRTRSVSELIYKLSFNSELLANNLKEHKAEIESFRGVIASIDKNLSELNIGQHQIVEKVDSLSTRVNVLEERLDHNEKLEASKGKLDVSKIILEETPRLILLAIIASILALVGINVM